MNEPKASWKGGTNLSDKERQTSQFDWRQKRVRDATLIARGLSRSWSGT